MFEKENKYFNSKFEKDDISLQKKDIEIESKVSQSKLGIKMIIDRKANEQLFSKIFLLTS